MRLFLVLMLLNSNNALSKEHYLDQELICIATYELSKDFFRSLKDSSTEKLVTELQKELLEKYEEGHFPVKDLEEKILDLHLKWSNEFDFLPPILENCVQNIR
ncbi:MAG: hypothetical protein CMI90_06680 [Pelagibacteraceae bacterium]|nr:hypothetical protein [Pelagibacteraceae bacterium]|tara:strand:+ start:380 stop:688 length:309 start_codon:yes stop_codon:yes gene_type:complete